MSSQLLTCLQCCAAIAPSREPAARLIWSIAAPKPTWMLQVSPVFKRMTSTRRFATAACASPGGNFKPVAMLSEHTQASVLPGSTEYRGGVHPQQATSEVTLNTPSRRRNEPGESLSRRERLRQRKNYTSFNSLPKELQSNQYIVSGYRLQLGAWDSIKSVFGLHNETGNIWSHLLGQCCSLCCQERSTFACKLHTALVSGSERQPLVLQDLCCS